MPKNCSQRVYNTIKKMIFMPDYEKNIPKIRYISKKILPLHTELQRESLQREFFFNINLTKRFELWLTKLVTIVSHVVHVLTSVHLVLSLQVISILSILMLAQSAAHALMYVLTRQSVLSKSSSLLCEGKRQSPVGIAGRGLILFCRLIFILAVLQGCRTRSSAVSFS